MPAPPQPIAALSESFEQEVTTTEHLGEDFFVGVLRWSFDTVATKLVAFVTDGYPQDEVASFETAVRRGTKRECINGAAVVRCEDAAVAVRTACLLGDEWRTRSGAVDSVKCFFREAKAFVRDVQGVKCLRGGRCRRGGTGAPF